MQIESDGNDSHKNFYLDKVGNVYAMEGYNCQRHLNKVIEKGHEIAESRGKKFIINK